MQKSFISVINSKFFIIVTSTQATKVQRRLANCFILLLWILIYIFQIQLNHKRVILPRQWLVLLIDSK